MPSLVKVPNTREVKKTTAVVDHDRGFLDLQDEIETPDQGFVACARALDDFHQRHFVDRAEEVQADEFALIRHCRRQAADR